VKEFLNCEIRLQSILFFVRCRRSWNSLPSLQRKCYKDLIVVNYVSIDMVFFKHFTFWYFSSYKSG